MHETLLHRPKQPPPGSPPAPRTPARQRQRDGVTAREQPPGPRFPLPQRIARLSLKSRNRCGYFRGQAAFDRQTTEYRLVRGHRRTNHACRRGKGRERHRRDGRRYHRRRVRRDRPFRGENGSPLDSPRDGSGSSVKVRFLCFPGPTPSLRPPALTPCLLTSRGEDGASCCVPARHTYRRLLGPRSRGRLSSSFSFLTFIEGLEELPSCLSAHRDVFSTISTISHYSPGSAIFAL